MWATFKSVLSLLLSYGFLLVGNALLGTLLGVRMEMESFGTTTTGVVMSAFYLGLFIGARFASRLILRVGHIRCFGVFGSLISITALVHVMWVDPWAWGFMRMVSGFCVAGMVTITESWLNSRTDNKRRGQVLSWYMITNYGAAGIGQFLLPLADPSEFMLFSLVSVIYSLALIPVLITRASAPKPPAPAPFSFGYLYRLAPVAFFGALGSGMMNASFYSLAPVFTQRIGLPLSGTSLFMATAVMSGVLFQWPFGRLSDRYGRAKVLGLVSLATALACAAIVIQVDTPGVLLFVTAGIYGSTVFTLHSIASARANDLSDPDQLMLTAGALLIAFGVGAIAGPLMSGAAMRLLGPEGLFIFNGLIAGLLSLYTLRSVAGRASARVLRQFVPSPGHQYSSGQLVRDVREQMDRDLHRISSQPGRGF